MRQLTEIAMSAPIHVAIVEDHQSIIDGYMFRLQKTPGIEVVGFSYYGEEIESLLAEHPVDVLLLDAHIPTSTDNASPFPVLGLLPKLLEAYPEMHILIITMHNRRSYIERAMEAGASGYVMKNDYSAIENLDSIVRSIASGGVYFSQEVSQALLKNPNENAELTPRQRDALTICAAYPNETTAELARRLGIADSTMRNLLSGAYLKLGVRNRAAALEEAHRRGYLVLHD
ncbi:MAG: response regulator transcription factor [Chloroflexota bacterium]